MTVNVTMATVTVTVTMAARSESGPGKRHWGSLRVTGPSESAGPGPLERCAPGPGPRTRRRLTPGRDSDSEGRRDSGGFDLKLVPVTA